MAGHLSTPPASSEARRTSSAAQRNRDPLLAVLRPLLPAAGLVLEVASGSGEHVVHFARALPGLRWQPSDPSPEARLSIAAWAAAVGLANVAPPLDLDAASPVWPIDHAEALLCSNMVHISPWTATEGLLRGAGRILPTGAPLILYGPFLRGAVPTAPGNVAFDADLRRRNPRWGLRDLDEVTRHAADAGFVRHDVIEMPANNLSVVFRRN